MSGTFITFEGGEGTGKSTQIDLLRAWLEARGHRVVVTREPGGTRLGAALRAILLDPENDPDAMTELLLLAADRREDVRTVVRPALERGEVVLCDRYTDSSTVYQGLAGGVAAEVVAHLNRLATDELAPDRTIVLDLDPEAGGARVAARNGGATGESRIDDRPLDFHLRVRRAYLELAAGDPARVRVVDGSGSVQAVHARVLAQLPEALR